MKGLLKTLLPALALALAVTLSLPDASLAQGRRDDRREDRDRDHRADRDRRGDRDRDGRKGSMRSDSRRNRDRDRDRGRPRRDRDLPDGVRMGNDGRYYDIYNRRVDRQGYPLDSYGRRIRSPGYGGSIWLPPADPHAPPPVQRRYRKVYRRTDLSDWSVGSFRFSYGLMGEYSKWRAGYRGVWGPDVHAVFTVVDGNLRASLLANPRLTRRDLELEAVTVIRAYVDRNVTSLAIEDGAYFVQYSSGAASPSQPSGDGYVATPVTEQGVDVLLSAHGAVVP
jgi:hypothetical protein